MLCSIISSSVRADTPNTWQDTLKQAQGQTVYFNAWGGSQEVNSYLQWARTELSRRFGITLKHVKVDDIAGTVSRIIAEKSAGRDTQGSVDLIWINGENFRSMKQHQLLYGPFTEQLPSWRFIDIKQTPTAVLDFATPTDGLEAPWGMARLIFMYDTAIVAKPPSSMAELLAFSRKQPGLFSYPAPPDFVGTTFLKQALIELVDNPARLQQPVAADFNKVTAPLWSYLDQLHPLLWRRGRTFPGSSTAMLPLLDDGELAFALSFNPGAATAAINHGQLPDSVRTYVHSQGTIGNTHFLAIPYNSSAKAAALVTINFLMSPEAQLRKADPKVWGDPTVLSLSRLNQKQRNAFDQLPLGIATLSPKQLGKALPEPHPSWVEALEQAWQKRYR